jgi:hypothetical protein
MRYQVRVDHGGYIRWWVHGFGTNVKHSQLVREVATDAYYRGGLRRAGPRRDLSRAALQRDLKEALDG